MRRSILTMTATAVLAAATLGLPPAGAEANGPADPADAATPTARFVWSAHADFLDRDPTAAELETHTTAIDTGTTTRRRLVTDLSTSPEWVATVVDQLYLDTLGRPADPTGRAHWIDRLRSGTTTVAQAAAAFYASPEYYRGLGGGTVATWVDDLYLKILGRPADPAGRTHWIAETTRTTRTSVAHRFYQSREPVRRRVTGLYQALLGRAPDPTGRDHWTNRLPRLGDLALARELAASTEYANRANRRFAPESITRLPGAGLTPHSWAIAVSQDGRHVAFTGVASDVDPTLESCPTCPTAADVFSWDRQTGQTTRVTETTNGHASAGAISGDGRYVAYSRITETLGAGGEDEDIAAVLAVWDRTTGLHTVVDDASTWALPTMSADGRYLAYRADAGTDDGGSDLLVWDRTTETSVVAAHLGDDFTAPMLSPDGRYLAYSTSIDPFTATAGPRQLVYRWDRETGATIRVSDVDRGGRNPSISGDGRFVVFTEGDDDEDVRAVVWDAGDGSTVALARPSATSLAGSISADGRFVVVERSDATAPGSGWWNDRHVALHDRATGGTRRLEATGSTYGPTISGDGSTVVFFGDDVDPGDGTEPPPSGIYHWSRPRFLG